MIIWSCYDDQTKEMKKMFNYAKKKLQGFKERLTGLPPEPPSPLEIEIDVVEPTVSAPPIPEAVKRSSGEELLVEISRQEKMEYDRQFKANYPSFVRYDENGKQLAFPSYGGCSNGFYDEHVACSIPGVANPKSQHYRDTRKPLSVVQKTA